MRPIDEAREKVEKINKEITADDGRFKNAVRIVHGDGSTFVLNYAFMTLIAIGEGKKKEEFIGVVAEHHLPLIFATDELDQYDEYKMTTKQFRK